ncbi:D-tyrosyl-tRNA(Tyr) deacylase [Anaerolineales bacterium]
MRVLLQRVSSAQVMVENQIVGKIEHGFVALIGIGHNDSEIEADFLAKKIVHLRVFDDENGKMNRSLLEVEGAVLAVSQFTLFADMRKGRRPSYTDAAHPDQAQPLFNYFKEALQREGVTTLQEGVFGAMMQVTLCNEGPATFWLDTE